MKEIKIEPIKIKDNWFADTQKQVDETYQKTIDYGRTQFVNKIVELEQQLQMLTRLYQNEKDKNDTLKRIINRCVEEIYNLIDDCDSVIGNKESSIVSKNKLMLMQKEKIIKILDLLKEIK